jgi:hypothetical protein
MNIYPAGERTNLSMNPPRGGSNFILEGEWSMGQFFYTTRQEKEKPMILFLVLSTLFFILLSIAPLLVESLGQDAVCIYTDQLDT